MPESSSSIDNEKTPRVLSSRDQRIFNHWRNVLTRPTLFSTQDSPPSDRNSYSPKDIPPPPVAPTTIAPRHHSPSVPIPKEDLKSAAAVRQQQQEHNNCVSIINKLFEKSPIIIFMNEQLQKVGCPVPVACAPCVESVKGGFDPNGGILICQNHIWGKRRTEATLTHEMVHAFDHCRFQFDTSNLKQVACAEVRANALSRECRFLDEVWYHLRARWHGAEEEFGFTRRMQQCVKRRAIDALMQHSAKPTRQEAETLVNQVFTNCFRDTRPFDELY